MTTKRYCFKYFIRIAIIKKTENTNVGKDVEKLEPLCIVAGIVVIQKGNYR
jgi:hypothetical protein